MGDDFMVQNPINVEKMTSRVLVVLRPYVTILGLEIAVSSIYQWSLACRSLPLILYGCGCESYWSFVSSLFRWNNEHAIVFFCLHEKHSQKRQSEVPFTPLWKKFWEQRVTIIHLLWQPAIITVSNDPLGYIISTQWHQLLNKDKL